MNFFGKQMAKIVIVKAKLFDTKLQTTNMFMFF